MDYIKYWLARPFLVERQIKVWQNSYPDLLEIDFVKQYVGLNAYAITVTDRKLYANKKKMLFTVPHAHEPAGTVACMNFINQILTGKNLDGSKSDIKDIGHILDSCILSFIPDANPDGRSRSPVDYWDGTKYSNDEFWSFMRGRDRITGKMWKRMGRWSIRNENPETIGIVYERLNEHEYVEPNRDFDSAYFKLAKRIMDKYGLGFWLDLHQTEFENSEYNAMILLPIVQNELPKSIQNVNKMWADNIVNQWKIASANPVSESQPLGYTGEQAEYFRRTWREFMPMIPEISTEVQNNNIHTPPQVQAELQEIAIKVSVDMLVSNKLTG